MKQLHSLVTKSWLSSKPLMREFSSATNSRRARFNSVLKKAKVSTEETVEEEKGDVENEYLRLIKKMQDLKDKNSAARMNMEEIDEVIDDLEKEKADREYEEIFNKERERIATKLAVK